MAPMYDYQCDVCGECLEAVVKIADRNKPIPHKHESETECLGMLKRDGVAAPHIWSGKTFLDGRHQTKAVMYDGERKVGHVAGHFGKSAKKK